MIRTKTLSAILRFLIVLIPAILCNVYQESAIQVTDRPLMSAQLKETKLSVVRSEACAECLGGQRFFFRIEGKTGQPLSLSFGDTFAKISNVRLVNEDRGIIIGEEGSGVSVVSILDLQSGAIVDQFGAWQPAVSPDGRYIAYVKTFPLHGVEGISNAYLIYDATASPEVNRPNASTKDHANVGFPIYPRGSENRPGDNMHLPESQIRVMATPFVWLGSSDILAFADRRIARQELTLVVTDVREGLRKALIFDHTIDPHDFFDPQKLCTSSLTQPETLSVAGISLSPKVGYIHFALAAGQPRQQCGQFDLQVPGLNP